MTNKFQFQITKMIFINQFTIWSLIFDNYLRFVICDLLFRAEASLREINHKIFASLRLIFLLIIYSQLY